MHPMDWSAPLRVNHNEVTGKTTNGIFILHSSFGGRTQQIWRTTGSIQASTWLGNSVWWPIWNGWGSGGMSYAGVHRWRINVRGWGWNRYHRSGWGELCGNWSGYLGLRASRVGRKWLQPLWGRRHSLWLVSRWQLCRHSWHYKLSVSQSVVQQVMTKALSNRTLSSCQLSPLTSDSGNNSCKLTGGMNKPECVVSQTRRNNLTQLCVKCEPLTNNK